MQIRAGSGLRTLLLVLGALALAIWSDTREPTHATSPPPVAAAVPGR